MPAGTRDAIIQLCPRDVIEDKYKRRMAHFERRRLSKLDDTMLIPTELMEVVLLLQREIVIDFCRRWSLLTSATRITIKEASPPLKKYSL